MESSDLGAVWLTLKLATIVTVLLLIIGTPIAWWLARKVAATSNGRSPIASKAFWIGWTTKGKE